MTVSIMNRLIRTLFETLEQPVFSTSDIQNIEPNDGIRHNLVKRAMKDGDLVQIKRGLYTLSPPLRKGSLNRASLANRLYYPSYVSMEYALSSHGWIPEGVATVTCATSKNPADFDTPIGRFTYKRIPQVLFFCGVESVSVDGEFALQARPLKALADYVYAHRLEWRDREPLIESLRIEENELETLSSGDFESIQGNYRTAPAVEAFLAGLRKDLKL
jgi:predicted transcriptional regulator of viral defense system